MKTISASIIAIFMMAAMATGAQELDKVKPVLDQKWRELAKTTRSFQPPNRTENWDYRITIPFPENWPPKAGNGLMYYAIPFTKNHKSFFDWLGCQK